MVSMSANKKPVVIDLFSGCGGLSSGARKAGFAVTDAFDIDPILTSSYGLNFPKSRVHNLDISKLAGSEIQSFADCHISGVIGGPPCQAFSMIGHRDEADPRRELLGHFFRIVSEIRPDFFLMENVQGVAAGSARQYLDACLAQVESSYTISIPTVLDASEYGCATKRKRIFVVGVRKDIGRNFDFTKIRKVKNAVTVEDAISDLSYVQKQGMIGEFDKWKIMVDRDLSPYAKKMRNRDNTFTGNQRTVHTEKVLSRFSKLKQGATDPVGKHKRLTWDGLCPTLRAGTGSDYGSYQSVRPIHPAEDRVITVREAARLQGFPDSHKFHPTIWHSFRMIGNSVSPILAKKILQEIKKQVFI